MCSEDTTSSGSALPPAPQPPTLADLQALLAERQAMLRATFLEISNTKHAEAPTPYHDKMYRALPHRGVIQNLEQRIARLQAPRRGHPPRLENDPATDWDK